MVLAKYTVLKSRNGKKAQNNESQNMEFKLSKRKKNISKNIDNAAKTS